MVSPAPVASTSTSTSSVYANESLDQISSLPAHAQQNHESRLSTSLPTPTPTIPASVVRGRPRSSSISNGSPSPSLGSTIPLPSLFNDPASPTTSPWAFKAAATTSISVIGPSPTARQTESSFSAPSTPITSNGLSPLQFGHSNSNSLSSSGSSSGSGWGHRPSLSVPGIVSPLPVPAGGVARGGRHRRTQSVSPLGFPVLSAYEVTGFAPSTSPTANSPFQTRSISTSPALNFSPPPSHPAMPPHPGSPLMPSQRRESPSRGFGRRESPPRGSSTTASPRAIATSSNAAVARLTMPRAEISPIRHNHGSFAHDDLVSTSPNGSSLFASMQASSLLSGTAAPSSGNHHAFSHAALLSGVRSHAIPHVDPPAFSADVRETPFTFVTDLSSPPFGPTSPNPYQPLPSISDLPPRATELDLEHVLRNVEGDAMGLGMEDDDTAEPTRPVVLNPPGRLGAISPPLLPLPAIPGEPMPVARPRAGSFSRDLAVSPASPASRFLETRPSALVGHCDERVTPEEQHRRSPPPESPLFLPRSPPIIPISASSLTSALHGLPPHSAAAVGSVFDSDPPTRLTTTTTVGFDVTSPAGTPAALSPPPPPSVSASTSLDSTLVSDDLPPPPSPHHQTIALPPPQVAPAPLPSHLGGPLLQGQHAPRRKVRGSKLGLVASADHIPKRHSPLVVDAVATNSEESPPTAEAIGRHSGEDDGEEDGQEKEEVKPASSVVQTTERRDVAETNRVAPERMAKIAMSDDDSRSFSPLGQPQHLEDASSETAYQTLEQHLARTPSPPKSCWDLDEPEEDEFDEGFASSSPPREGIAPGLDLGGGIDNAGDLALARMGRQERALAGPEMNIPLSNGVGALGFMDVDQFQQQQQRIQYELGVAAGHGISALEGGHDSQEVCAIDEETLSALERIFVCAKSDATEERIRVSNHLPEWLLGVDICEAAEYVLPLLIGLATDPADYVKEAFAMQLDRVMWHFFSLCPLIELDPSHEGGLHRSHAPIQANGTEAVAGGSPVPSRYPSVHQHHQHQHSESTMPNGERSPTSTHFGLSDDSAASSTPPPTSKTSPSNTEVADSPRISSATFTSLLGALLTDQSSGVAKGAESALVRFLCRLKGKQIPFESPVSSPLLSNVPLPYVEEDSTPTPTPADGTTPGYQLTPEARRLLEDEIVTGIVLGLARLDEDEPLVQQQAQTQAQEEESERSSTPASASSQTRQTNSSPQLCSSPEEDAYDDGWLTSDSGPFADSPLDPPAPDLGWGLPTSTTNGAASTPSEPKYSTFSPDPNFCVDDDETTIGKVVSMSLVAAIASTDCLDPHTLTVQILPEVEKLNRDGVYYVRREAAQALGSLARTLPLEVVEARVLPMYSVFAHDDNFDVRRAACLVLPAICKRLPSDLRRRLAVDHMKQFSCDSSRIVRSGALEVCGEMTYLFYEDPSGVPDEILSVFLGQTISTCDARTSATDAALAPQTSEDEDEFTPLANPLDSPPAAVADLPPTWNSAASARDPDRPVMCAFNFPAIVLTLGCEKWPSLRPYHFELCQHKTAKVRQSLASSLHEVAKIIGPAQADVALLEPFTWYLTDHDQIQSALLDNLTSLLFAFGSDAGRSALAALVEAWDKITVWRRRETIAKYLGRLGAHYMLVGSSDEVLLLLAKAFGDEVAAVREQAVYAVPYLIQATIVDEEARAKMWAFLSVFYEDASYRNRVVYTSCVLASIRVGVPREIFEEHFLPSLVQLAQDRVINVRIAVGRVASELCQNERFYAELSSRTPLSGLLRALFHCTDRDVRDPIVRFYVPDGDSRSSTPESMMVDRSVGVQSRLRNHHGEVDDPSSDMEEDDRPLPTATRSNPFSHGVHFERDLGSDDSVISGEGDDDEIMDFDEDGAANGPDALWTRDMVDDSFVEVHRGTN
ncbi:hypothetical protein MVLG_05880 [Microbotryum lychnidis-dioicae p1A1 Lamole]|uniref:Uncharacterized protein n=1 Tax=Microbotryum lychnidis-dioicae (strain p1A1 Lamole / MvSl-1064) TaxID=683840 RepID=U5HFK4_USTV1|nr:hypothetical protein MVLG_05880 [Microbotryum lychnidis-dioicae p1A1 Lamole]|eukprot:KDE03630.1 hypothetical protein MVLG_05880 [Microbotryum lychnidis-dioicae p1A1 Lamole]